MTTTEEATFTPKNKEEELLFKALQKTTRKVREEGITFKEAQITDFYPTGVDRTDGTLIQNLEAIYEGEDKVQVFAIRGIESIKSVFGEPNSKGEFSKITYEDGIPRKVELPERRCCREAVNGTLWWQLKKV